jgi:hypothetical protein
MTSPIDDNMILPIRKEVLPPVKRIAKDDNRYSILQTIPLKEHDEQDNSEYVYLAITDDKDYFITVQFTCETPNVVSSGIPKIREEEQDDYYHNHNYLDYPDYKFDDDDDEPTKVVEIQVQTFRYEGNRVIWLSGEKVFVR